MICPLKFVRLFLKKKIKIAPIPIINNEKSPIFGKLNKNAVTVVPI